MRHWTNDSYKVLSWISVIKWRLFFWRLRQWLWIERPLASRLKKWRVTKESIRCRRKDGPKRTFFSSNVHFRVRLTTLKVNTKQSTYDVFLLFPSIRLLPVVFIVAALFFAPARKRLSLWDFFAHFLFSVRPTWSSFELRNCKRLVTTFAFILFKIALVTSKAIACHTHKKSLTAKKEAENLFIDHISSGDKKLHSSYYRVLKLEQWHKKWPDKEKKSISIENLLSHKKLFFTWYRIQFGAYSTRLDSAFMCLFAKMATLLLPFRNH